MKKQKYLDKEEKQIIEIGQLAELSFNNDNGKYSFIYQQLAAKL